jgi:tetratricopeptide (TPR) repeat protein
LAILPRDKHLHDPSIFDAVVDTGLGWVQFSDAVFRSVRGSIAIGGGAGTLAELAMAYITSASVVLLGSESSLAGRIGERPLDERDLVRFEVTDDPEEALAAILRTGSSTVEIARAQADEAHFSSYPFGSRADYLSAAHDYVAANESNEDLARFEDAIGDHYYYTVGDYLRAGAHYLRARKLLGSGKPSFSAYLTAIALESIGMALAGAGEHELASSVSRRSAAAYLGAIEVSPENEHHLLRHSAAGLRGDSNLFAAVEAHKHGNDEDARRLVSEARRSYEDALVHHPPYGDSVSSSNFERAIAPVEALEKALGMSGHADE